MFVLPLALLVALPCFPSDQDRAAINAVYELDATSAPIPEHAAKVIEQAAALTDRAPNEPLHYAVANEFIRMYQPTRAAAFAKAWSERGTAAARLGSALLAPRKERLPLLRALTAAHPGFAQAWLALAEVTQDASENQHALAKVRALCPTLPALPEAVAKHTPAELPALIARARAVGLPASERAALLRELWKMELGLVHTGAALKSLQERVAQDTAGLVAVLPDGLQRLELQFDAAALFGQINAAVSDALLARYPYSSGGLDAARASANRVRSMADPEQRLDAARALALRFPAVDTFAELWFDALPPFGSGPEHEALNNSRREAAALYANAQDSGTRSPQLEVARLYIQLDKCEDALALIAKAEAMTGARLAFLPAQMAEAEQARARAMQTLVRLELLLQESHLQTQRLEAARQLRPTLDRSLLEAEDTVALAVIDATLQRDLGRYGDALSTLIDARRFERAQKQPTNRALQRLLATVWAELGGQEAALQRLIGGDNPEPTRTAWKRIDKPLPEVSLKDAMGQPWSRKDVMGAPTYVSIWASWCAPCKEELKLLPALAKRLAEKSIRVVSFNVDENPLDATAYLRDHPAGVPVIMGAASLVGAVTQLSPIPRSWLLDGSAMLRHEALGFRPSDDWAAQTAAEITALLDPAPLPTAATR